MAKEIERKFLVNGTAYRAMATGSHRIVQGYLSTDPDSTVRIRVRDNEAFLTVKSRNRGAVRDEWEYRIPVDDALDMLATCHRGRLIEKTRYLVPSADGCGLVWEVDEFHGCHQGLTVAEIELPSPDTAFSRPGFIGDEVTGDPAYYNSSLSAEG